MQSVGVVDKNQTGYFPALQKTGIRKNSKKGAIDHEIIVCSPDDVIVNIENNQRASCNAIAID
jgi:hypothetical protein